MKICYVLSTSSVAGGANRSLLDMIRQLKMTHNNFTCFVILNGHGTMEQALQALGIKCYVLTYANAIRSRLAWRTLGKRIYNVYAKKKLRSILKNEKPDFIHNNSLPTTIGMEIAMQDGFPYICHIRENIWAGLGMDFYAPEVVQKTLNKATCVIAISEYIRRAYDGFYENNNTVVLNDGIVIEDYYLPQREILSKDKVKVLIVGVINPQKGQADAVKAIEKLSLKGYNIDLTILGAAGRWKETTDYVDSLKAYVESHNLKNVVFLEPINDSEELKRLRSHFDINLICSSAEGLGRTTIESMLSGALTIGADAGATPEIISHQKTGLLYSSGNIDSLASCIEWALLHRDVARRIANEGQDAARNRFSIEEYCKNIMVIYEGIKW